MASKEYSRTIPLSSDLNTPLLTVPWTKVFKVQKLQVTTGASPCTATIKHVRYSLDGSTTGTLLNNVAIKANSDVERYLYYLRPGDKLIGGATGSADANLILSIVEVDVPIEQPPFRHNLAHFKGNDTESRIDFPVPTDFLIFDGFDRYLKTDSGQRTLAEPMRFFMRSLGGNQWRDINYWYQPLTTSFRPASNTFNPPIIDFQDKGIVVRSQPGIDLYGYSGVRQDSFNSLFAEKYFAASFTKGDTFFCTSYKGTGATLSINHGLAAKPSFIIIYSIYDSTDTAAASDSGIMCYHDQAISGGTPLTHYFYLDENTGLAVNDVALFSSVNNIQVTINSTPLINTNGASYGIVMFANGSTKYDKCASGAYTGNATENGPTITTGFEPKLVFIKQVTGLGGADNTSGAEMILADNDSAVNGYQDNFYIMSVGGRVQQAYGYAANALWVKFLSTGFQVGGTTAAGFYMLNRNAERYIYTALG